MHAAELFDVPYVADPIHSSVVFAVDAMGVSTFRASFAGANAKLEGSASGPRLSGSADVESISIHEPEQFRAHLLSDAFFGARDHPKILFRSDAVELGDDGAATVVGQLTVKGISRPLTARGTWARPAQDPTGKRRSHLSLAATVNRRDFDMTYDPPLPSGESALGDKVTITVELSLVASD